MKTKYKTRLYLPPANEVWGKVIFLHVCVILSTGGHAWLPGGHAWLGDMCGWGWHAWLLGREACMVAGGMCGCGGVHGCGGHAWLLGGMCGCWGHVWLWGGHAWLCRGHAWLWGHMWLQGVCMVAGGVHGCGGGMHGWGGRGHAWFLGGMHGCWGVHRIQQSMSRQYASYWNAFLLCTNTSYSYLPVLGTKYLVFI